MNKKSKALRIGIVLILAAAFCGPALAAEYQRAGTIHIMPGYYGPRSNYTGFPNAAVQKTEMIITNPGNAAINISLDFYDSTTGVKVVSDCALPAPFTSGTVIAHGNAGWGTNDLADLASYENVLLTPVLSWAGNVAIAPTVMLTITFEGDAEELITRRKAFFIDDSLH